MGWKYVQEEAGDGQRLSYKEPSGLLRRISHLIVSIKHNGVQLQLFIFISI